MARYCGLCMSMISFFVQAPRIYHDVGFKMNAVFQSNQIEQHTHLGLVTGRKKIHYILVNHVYQLSSKPHPNYGESHCFAILVLIGQHLYNFLDSPSIQIEKLLSHRRHCQQLFTCTRRVQPILNKYQTETIEWIFTESKPNNSHCTIRYTSVDLGLITNHAQTDLELNK